MCKREKIKSMVEETEISVDKIDHTKVKNEDITFPNEKMTQGTTHVATENTHCADLTSKSLSNRDCTVISNESEGMIMDFHEKTRCYDKLPENNQAIESNDEGHMPVKKGDCNELDEDSDVTKNNDGEDLTIKREECDELYEDAKGVGNNFEENVAVEKEAELAYEMEDSIENAGVKRENEQEEGNNRDTNKK